MMSDRLAVSLVSAAAASAAAAGSMPTYWSFVELTFAAEQPTMDRSSTAARTQTRTFFFIVFLQMWWDGHGQREKTTLPYGTGSK